MNKNLAQMYEWLKEDLPEHADFLIKLCSSKSAGNNFFFTHVYVAIDYFDKKGAKFDSSLTNELLSSYSYLTLAYFCLDALVDGHSLGVDRDIKSSDIAKALTLFLATGLSRLHNFSSREGINSRVISEKVISLFSQHVLALNQESQNQKDAKCTEPYCDYENIVGRANISLLMFEIVGYICGKKVPETVINILKSLVYFIQMSDDLNDWEIDFKEGRYTSFLRECCSKFDLVPSLGELKELVYVKGVYESRLAQVIMGLDAMLDELRSIGAEETKLMEYIQAQRKETKEWLAQVINEKNLFIEELSSETRHKSGSVQL